MDSTVAGAQLNKIDFHFLGEVEFDDVQALQRRLVYERQMEQNRRIVVLLCEHPELITVGRSGSRRDVRLSAEQLARKQLCIRWVKRGGGCVYHAPGQLVIYPILSLTGLQWTVAEYADRLRAGLLDALRDLSIPAASRPDCHGVLGRSGLLAAVGISVRQWTTCHGAFLNVQPPMATCKSIDTLSAQTASGGTRSMSSLLAERRLPVKMSSVRASIVEKLANAFSSEDRNIHTGHPWLRQQTGTIRGNIATAS